MNRLFTLLIISVLFSQSAWAFHDIEFNNTQEHAYTQAAAQNDDTDGSYDHCGHASAHLVGLLTDNAIDTYAAINSNAISVKNITSSVSCQPPVPPPTL